MSREGRRVLILAARQPDFAALLAEDGFEVDIRTRPLADGDGADVDLAVVFRGRLIGRNQAASLVERGIPVVEVLTVEPPSSSSANWIRLSNRVTKSDLAQVVHALADWAASRNGAHGLESAPA